MNDMKIIDPHHGRNNITARVYQSDIAHSLWTLGKICKNFVIFGPKMRSDKPKKQDCRRIQELGTLEIPGTTIEINEGLYL